MGPSYNTMRGKINPTKVRAKPQRAYDGMLGKCATRLRDIMKSEGWSYSQFAKKMGRHRPEITKWLSGTHNFTLETLEEIETKTGYTILHFLV